MNEVERKALLAEKERLEYLLTDEAWHTLLNNNVITVYNDTDSAGISLHTLSDKYNSDYGIKIVDGQTITDEGYALVDECGEFVNSEFEKWFHDTTNTNHCYLNFKREKICDVGLWLKKMHQDEEAKKNYIVHVLDDEGVKHPKFKYTGVKLARSVIPANLKRAAKDIVEHLLLTQDRSSTDNLIQKFYDDFCNMPVSERSIIQRCNNIDKYKATKENHKVEKRLDEWDSWANGGTKYVTCDNHDPSGLFLKGTPGHIRAAMYFNHVIKSEKLTKYEAIRSGEIVNIVYLNPKNKYGIDRIAFIGEYPSEFEELFQIDNKILFEKLIYEEITRIYKSVGWPSFNPANNYAFNLLDLMNGIIS